MIGLGMNDVHHNINATTMAHQKLTAHIEDKLIHKPMKYTEFKYTDMNMKKGNK